MLTMDLKQKTIIITGASSGIGATLAQKAGQQGAKVVLAARTESKLDVLAKTMLDSGSEALAVVTDITDPSQCRDLVQQTVETFGGVDILILNAGVSMWAAFEVIEDVSFFKDLMDVNYMGAVYCVQSALPHLKKNRGLIAQMSTAQALMGFPHHAGYAASKHALQGFLTSLEIEMQESVRFLHIYLGWIRDTNLRRNAFSRQGQPMGEQKRSHNSESIGLEVCTDAILEAIAVDKRKIYLPAKLGFIPFLNAVYPSLLQRRVSKAVQTQP